MSQKPPLKKLVVELRYKPKLGFYGRMDSFGVELSSEFPDWQRSPLTLELRHKKKHRRLFLSVKRAFLDVDNADSELDFAFAQRLLSKLAHGLDIDPYLRVGIRQWFVIDLNRSFAIMADQFVERFLPESKELAAVLNDRSKDVAYVRDYETADGWRYNLRMGPMEKKQWFSVVPHEQEAYEQAEEGEQTFENFKESFPEQFLYLDLDCYQEDLPADQLDQFLGVVRRRSHDLAAKLIEICRR